MSQASKDDLQLESFETKEELQCELVKVKTRYRRLCELQNMQFGSPAAKIIPEILTLIFEELIFDETNVVPYPPPSDRERISGPRNHHPCLPLSHVCRYWRRVALDSPHLWGILYTNCSRRWFDFVSERAMNAPLFLRLHHDVDNGINDDFDDFGLPLEDCLDRFKEIHLDVATTGKISWAQVIIDGDAPILEVLEIRKNYWFSDFSSDTLSAHTKPRLQVLRTHGCNINFRYLSGLQELVIDLANTPSSLSATDVLESLWTLQSLRSLDFHNILDDDDEVSTDLTVRLPHLNRLSISARRWVHLSLVQHIVAPKLESLRLRCSQGYSESPVPSTTLVPICQQLFSASQQPQRVTWDLNRGSYRSIMRALFLHTDSCHPALASVELEFDSDDDMLYERDICQCLSVPFGQPRVLSITTASSSSVYISSKALSRDFLCLLTQVEEVYLESGAVELFAANTRPYPTIASTSVAPLPLPALKTITFYNDDLELQEFESMLEERKARDVPIINLTIFGSEDYELDHYSFASHVETFKVIPTDDEEYKEYPSFLVG